MDREKSFKAVKDAVGTDHFFGNLDVEVRNSEGTFYYRGVNVQVSYNIGYMQMDVIICWEDDTSMPDYHSLGLHGKYNSNFQDFKNRGRCLSWDDNGNNISVTFK